MPSYDASNSQCRVFTEKDGLLSAIAHDLEIEVTAFTVIVDQGNVEARLKTDSLRVLHALKEGQPIAVLSDKDKKEIEGNIVKDVLGANRFPEVLFSSTCFSKAEDHVTLEGNLTLHGVTKEVAIGVRVDGKTWIGEVTLHQPDFGIKPYTAMLGTLKVKPSVRVVITIPRD